MKNSAFAGIDISKNFFHITIINNNNKIILQSKFNMNKNGFLQLKKSVNKLKQKQIYFVMESTSIYHLNLYYFLIDNNFKAAIVNPLLIHNFIKSISLRKTSTDEKDAEKIAYFALANLNKIDFSGKKFNSIRSVSRERDALSKNISRLKTEIKNVLHVLFPELAVNVNIFTKTMIKLLLKAPGKFPIINMTTKQITSLFNSTNGNKITISAKEIKQLAHNSVGIKNNDLEFVLKTKIGRLLFIQKQIKIVEKSLHNLVKENMQQDLDILTSVNGIGKTTAEKFLIEIRNINYFNSHNQLRAYIGTDPTIKQSGTSIHRKGKISKRGNAYLRKTIWLMAVGVIRHCNKFKKYFHKKMQEGKKYKQAVIAVANKLIKTLYALLKNKTKFEPNYSR